jgi:phosphatidylglycerophosphate synthase
MNLHRSDSNPDWTNVKPADRTVWQNVAVNTRGIVTPPNIITVIGLGLVIIGLMFVMQRQDWLGIGLIIVGRLLDLVDGWLAELTQTKSPVGELFDAAADKIGTILTIIVFYAALLAPWWLLTAMLLPHIIISVISLQARRQKKQLHPSRLGKVSMAALWVGLFGFVLLRAAGLADVSIVIVTVYLVSVLSVLMSSAAAVSYGSELRDA